MKTNESIIHIGHLIHEQLKTNNRSVSWLAREIHCTRNNVYKIFNKPSLDGDLILKISVAMNFNFFQYYTASFLESIRSLTGEENLKVFVQIHTFLYTFGQKLFDFRPNQ